MEVGAEEGERLVPDHLGESRVRQDDRPQALQAEAGHQGSLHGELEKRIKEIMNSTEYPTCKKI